MRVTRRGYRVLALLVASTVTAITVSVSGHGPSRPATADEAVPTVPGTSGTPAATATSPATPAPTSPPTPTSPPAPTYSLTDPTSIWVVVNKRRPLDPLTYAPTDLTPVGDGQVMRRAAANALLALFAAARAHGLLLRADSGYRSYAYQVGVHARVVRNLGQAEADIGSALPGYSEHQTGWAVDVGGGGCDITTCFGSTPQGRWVAANAYRWGFIVRYPQGAQAITGYEYEPWHIRYVGTELAGQMHARGIATLEQFFGLPAAPTPPSQRPAG